MPNKWVQALKEYNKGKSEWCIPKKGGKEYQDIKKIMNGETNEQNKNKEKIKEYKKKLDDILISFLEINSLINTNINQKRNTNEEFRKIYDELDGAFNIYMSYTFYTVNDIKLVIKEYKQKINEYKKLLKKLKMI